MPIYAKKGILTINFTNHYFSGGFMRKNKLYMVFIALTIIFLFATAAVCTQCEALEDIVEEAIDANIDVVPSDSDNNEKDSKSNNDKTDESKPGDNNDSTKKDEPKSDNNNDKKDEPKSEDGKKDGENNEPVLAAIYLNSDEFFPNLQYTFTCDASDPDNDTIFFAWHVDAGLLDNFEAATVVWTAPDAEGLYEITLEISDGWGGFDSITKTIAVGAIPQNAPPVIQSIAVYPDGAKYTDDTYDIQCFADDPNFSITGYDFTITGGNLYGQSANLIKWDTPDLPGTYTVMVTVTDKEGNTATSSKDIIVEQHRVEITDIIVQIEYIAASSSYYIKGIIVDPKSQISDFQWSATGGDITDQNGHLGVWNTPPDPGTYNLTLTANTFGGDSVQMTKEFVVKSPQ